MLSRLTLQASHFTPHAYELDRPNKRDKLNQPDRRDMSNVETKPLILFSNFVSAPFGPTALTALHGVLLKNRRLVKVNLEVSSRIVFNFKP